MKRSFQCWLLLCLAVGTSAQDITLEVKFNSDKSKIRMHHGANAIKPDAAGGSHLTIDLNNKDLDIVFSEYTGTVNIKLGPEDGLECEGIALTTDKDKAKTKFSINHGVLSIGTQKIQFGSVISIVLPAEKLKWTINTSLAKLAACPKITSDTPEPPHAAQKPVPAGIIYYDALRLSRTKDLDTIKDILRYYTKFRDDLSVNGSEIAKELSGNDFLAPLAAKIAGDISADQHAIGALPSFLSGSSIGGINVTNFADGLAKFLVKRFKEELTITFFERFKDTIEANIELQTLFPQTRKVLLTIDKEIYRFSAYLNALREAFIKDLTNLYPNFKKFSALSKYRPFFDAHQELETIILNAFYFIDQYSKGTHPGDVLARYDVNNIKFTNTTAQSNTRSAVSLVQAVSASFKSLSPDHYWVPADSATSLLVEDQSRDIYFGLVYQLHGSISFELSGGSMKRLDALLLEAKRKITPLLPYRDFVETFVSQAQEVNEYLSELKAKQKEDIDYNDYYKLYNASLDLLEHAFSFVDLPLIDLDAAVEAKIKLESGRWIHVAHSTGDCYVDIRTKNYSSAILNLVSVIDTVFTNCPRPVVTGILKYGTFAASVAAAKNSDEVEAAIEAIALPSGSSRIKRESISNISLNAFVGLFGGHETIKDVDNSKKLNSFGITAPVGVSFSWGTDVSGKVNKKVKPVGGKSNGFFISLIDLGAITALRFGDTTTTLPTIELRNIIAPGIFFSHGFGKVPLSMNIGVQYGPGLRKVEKTGLSLADKGYWRIGISFVVDIPLLNFYTKSR